jgi:hypothetical protein
MNSPVFCLIGVRIVARRAWLASGRDEVKPGMLKQLLVPKAAGLEI